MGLLKSFFQILRYWLSGRNYVRTIGSGVVEISASASIAKSRIYVYPGASLTIENGCNIKSCTIAVTKGSCIVDVNTIAEGVDIIVDNGEIAIGNHSKISCKRIWVRYGGILSIGDYTNINSGSEIRCDEKVTIGDFNQISYNIRIWDTNTHSILPAEERRKVAIEKYPYFGYEQSRPKTAPVVIGNDCWIGENSAILKGTRIGDCCVVGYGTLLSGDDVPDNTTAISKRELLFLKR